MGVSGRLNTTDKTVNLVRGENGGNVSPQLATTAQYNT